MAHRAGEMTLHRHGKRKDAMTEKEENGIGVD